MAVDPVAFTLLADWCIDLSAGSFAAAFLVTTQRPLNARVILTDLLYSVAFFLLAFILTSV